MLRAIRIWTVLLLVTGVVVVLAVSMGSASIGVTDVFRLLFEPDNTVQSEIIRGLRVPRVLAALTAGALLSLAGGLMQILLRNPLADPYVLGLSGGSAVGALGAMILGLGALFVTTGAFAGALLSVMLVFALARAGFAASTQSSEREDAPRLLLTGVVLASGWSAVIAVMLTVAPEAQLRGMLFWLMGDLGGAAFHAWVLLAVPVIVVASYVVSRDLNVLLRGELVAQSLGVNSAGVRRVVFALASAATALAVTTAGAVGFVGLIVPHALRLVIGNDQRVLLPACALAGGSLLVIADTIARTIIAPAQLPVGVVTAIIGVPVFMFLLIHSKSGRSS